MLFNSLDFAVFLPIVFVLYWFVVNKQIKYQNLLIVMASYVFYGWWDWRFLSLILFSTLVDYTIGLALSKQRDLGKRKLLLWVSVIVNLGFLGFFKYYNFFIDNFVQAFSFFGRDIQPNTLNIILPVGISFYTFQTLSYTIDVYKRQLEPTKDFISFAAFVSFFPQLVAGPIERASNLLPQFYVRRQFNYNKAVDGLRQILWGLFKKVIIADNCANVANTIFNGYETYSASTLALGAVFFAFQIYGDFSGYSDIAIGTSRLFGFDLKQNFATPYFSRDMAEFWRRWHISLSTWFRDYVYIPLGGSRGSKWNQVRNVFIIFIVSGFWHGANWTFIIWGALNALYFLPLLLRNKNRMHTNVVAQYTIFPNLTELLQMLITFGLTVLAWVFFRAENVSMAIDFISKIANSSLFTLPQIRPTDVFVFLLIFVLIEWAGRRNLYAIERLWYGYPKFIRLFIYYTIAMIIFFYGGKTQEFIYFQF
ncbi:D-alanyl-lipoteichoic acid acyltransferase DltB (MBOAT superfamily) [Winogradskyella epiphytica]|uniref:D-alanyl-lipoteichoic acid acyltransferase DltB (MBOAT superfamily) n=1 Tax=Winogradskyella epiphytica TaxID=262005 RepID=A0A2V4XGE9_9FLAO|nr:MBOAT family O-acyltransferase [Winogradskyella epiphytica]PYE82135.1 D-alanyl-lipoteichoic acid acyltransferase DltB (MBOAT superfamily) [Winogradskyella epiphytica]GGW60304.1 O-acyltransferase [Winogradskyella epiphytica]